MKITLVYGAVPGCDYGLHSAVEVISRTLEELGENITEINLMRENIPYYDGEASSAMKKAANTLKNSDGIIIAFTTNLFAPAACMQNFFEHLSFKTVKKCLKDKNVFVVTASASGGEASSINYAGKVVRHFGGYDAVRLGLNANLLKAMEFNQTLKECIEKYAEDYYRIIRQNRKFILPSDHLAQAVTGDTASVMDEDYEQLMKFEKKEEVTAEVLQTKYDLQAFTEKQEEDIKEITQFFAGKYKENVNITPNSHISSRGSVKKDIPPMPRAKTVKQTTQSLVHHFKPQVTAGLTAVIQINITGAEGFEGYLSIVNLECEYTDGTAENPDLTIMCESGVWADVLKGKYSAQKAFMVGYLKVRGNFVLLTKFDQAFGPQV